MNIINNDFVVLEVTDDNDNDNGNDNDKEIIMDDIRLDSPEKEDKTTNTPAINWEEETQKIKKEEEYRFRLFLGSNVFCFLSGMFVCYFISL